MQLERYSRLERSDKCGDGFYVDAPKIDDTLDLNIKGRWSVRTAKRQFVAVRFFRGMGLGNRLFPWARAILFARDHGWEFVAPFWPRWSTTGLFRGGIARENFLRQISLLGQLRAPQDYIKGCNKMYALATATIISETAPPPSPGGIKYLRIFSGEGRAFEGINGRNEQLRLEFASIVKPKWLRLAQQNRNFTIGINIRRGKDFRDPASEDEYLTTYQLRTPLRWFITALRYIRSTLGYDARALVVSDGSPEDLSEILKEGNIRLLRPGCASSDLYALSYSKVLIGSGGSTFSAWASFFAQCPTITIRGQSLRRFFLDHGSSIYVGDFIVDDPPELFRENLLQLKSQIADDSVGCEVAARMDTM
jgi:hypothetical protein